MTTHFSDPYVAAVFATVCSSTRGCTRAELMAENPEEEPGEFNNAIKELKTAGAVDMLRGLFFEMGRAAPSRDSEMGREAPSRDPAPAAPDASTTAPTKRGRPRKSPLATAFAADMRAMSDAAPVAPVQPQEKDTPMPTTATPAERPRHIVLLALRELGPTNIERVRADIGKALDAKAVANALYNLVKAGQVEMTGTGKLKTYRITRAGLKALDEKAVAPAPDRAAKPAKAARKGKAPPKRKAAARDTRSIDEINAAARKAASRSVAIPAAREPEVLPRPVFAPEGFRVGLFSDGGLAIVADDTEMHLDAAQTRALIGFLEHTTVLRSQA